MVREVGQFALRLYSFIFPHLQSMLTEKEDQHRYGQVTVLHVPSDLEWFGIPCLTNTSEPTNLGLFDNMVQISIFVTCWKFVSMPYRVGISPCKNKDLEGFLKCRLLPP